MKTGEEKHSFPKKGAVQGTAVKKLAFFCIALLALAPVAGNSVGVEHRSNGALQHEWHAGGQHFGGHGQGMHFGPGQRQPPRFIEHPRFHRHHGVIIGVPFLLAPPVYASPPVYVIEQPPSNYIEQGTAYSYYCPDPAGYYPDVQVCLSEWLRVVPGTSPVE